MVEAGLALGPKTIDSYDKTIEFSLLYGQQMRVLLQHISSGGSFRVALYPEVVFDCFLIDDMSLEKLNDYLNKFVIIFIEKVVENRYLNDYFYVACDFFDTFIHIIISSKYQN